jgi:hypothetical protein
VIGVALGFMLCIGAAICAIGAIVHRNPGKSFWEIYCRCGVYRQGDLSPSGWKLHRASWILVISGLLVAATSVFLFGV